MKEHEETIKKAAKSGMGKEPFREAMRRIFRASAPRGLTDEQIENELPVPPKKPEPPTHEQAMCELKGVGYSQHLHNIVAAAVKAKERAVAATDGLKKKVEQAFMALISFQKERLPEAIIAGLQAFGIAALLVFVVLGEIHLLVFPLADWMGIEHVGSKAAIGLGAIAAVMLTFLALLTHWAWEHRKGIEGRVCGAALAAIALMLAHLRSSQGAFDQASDRLIFFAFCLSLSVGAPISTAWLLSGFWPTLNKLLDFLAENRSLIARLRYDKEQLDVQKNFIADADRRIADVLGEFTAAYEDIVFGAERKWELARAIRRTENAGLAESEIHFEFVKNQKPPRDYLRWVVLALGALILLWGIGAHAEPVEPQPVWWTVVCDRSDTSADLSCTKDRIAGALKAWAEKAMLSHKGMFKVLIIGGDIAGVEEFFKISAPLAKDIKAPLSKGRDRWKTEALAQFDAKLLPNKVGAASAIVDAVYKASMGLSGLPGEKHLTVISDLREYSCGGRLDFEHKVPTPEEFLQFLKSLPRPPDLLDVDVVACGFHTAAPAGGRLDTAALLKVRAAWEAAFKFWGVNTSIREECAF